jgi:hypothetical protein
MLIEAWKAKTGKKRRMACTRALLSRVVLSVEALLSELGIAVLQ